jgi:hypothetical protein
VPLRDELAKKRRAVLARSHKVSCLGGAAALGVAPGVASARGAGGGRVAGRVQSVTEGGSVVGHGAGPGKAKGRGALPKHSTRTGPGATRNAPFRPRITGSPHYPSAIAP